MVVAKDDWRLTNQMNYLKDRSWSWKPYTKYREGWDHDHCSFCWQKFTESGTPETLHEGYSTQADYYWVCAQCFEDFKEMFAWRTEPSSNL